MESPVQILVWPFPCDEMNQKTPSTVEEIRIALQELGLSTNGNKYVTETEKQLVCFLRVYIN